MNKTLVLILMLAATTLSAVTLDQAQVTVSPYLLSGEQIDMQPTTLTTSGLSSYWVLEAKSFNQIQVMFPVNSETGKIETESAMTEVLKTHYLANFIATDNTITNYLDSQLTFAQQRGDYFALAKSDLEFYETQLGNVTLTTLNPLKSALTTGKSQSETLRQQIINTKSTLTTVKSPQDVVTAQDSLYLFFSKQGSFLTQSETIASKADDFLIELVGNEELKANNPSLLQALQGVVNTYSLRQSVTTQKDNLQQNKATFDSFFSSLDEKSEYYYAKLTSRLQQGGDIGEINEIKKSLNSYLNNYTQINNDASAKAIPQDYEGFSTKMTELYSMINESQSYCSSEILAECIKAKENYARMESLITQLKNIVSSYAKECTDGSQQTCTGGTQTCVNGAWGACKPASGGMNWTLIIIMAAVILGLVAFKFKDKLLPPTTPATTSTDWQTQQYKF